MEGVLNAQQNEVVEHTFVDLTRRRINLLDFIGQLGDRVTSRDAEQRIGALNELCAVLLKLLADEHHHSLLDDQQLDHLLAFLLPKVEDNGHLCDLLIVTLHKMLRLFHSEKPLSPERLDQILATMFDTGSVQSYGQRDRLLLFAIFGHLVDTHAELLRFAAGAQRVVLAFVRSAQGEREPRVLLRIFSLHHSIAANFKMGVLAEDMFELAACYFPIEYEPNEIEKGPLVTREQLRCGCEHALLAHPSFWPFCLQLIAEKLLEMDANAALEDADGVALVRRQLEICEFFINTCENFPKIGVATISEHVEDMMTAFRLIFTNPALQNNAKLVDSAESVIGRAARALANAAETKSIGRQMAESTIENVEPFVLQAEMGTADRAFRLLRCIALSHPTAQCIVVPRALYWLNVLIGGKTLRSGENRAEIAGEALSWLPIWLRLCFSASGSAGTTGIFAQGNGGTPELVHSNVWPLMLALNVLSEEAICPQEATSAAQCESMATLLLPFCTGASGTEERGSRSLYVQEMGTKTEFWDMCREITGHILNWAGQAAGPAVYALSDKRAAATKQFLALFALCDFKFCAATIQSDRFQQQLPSHPNLLLLLPPLVHPLLSEIGGNHPVSVESSPVERLNTIVPIVFEQHSRTDTAVMDKAAYAALTEIAERLGQMEGAEKSTECHSNFFWKLIRFAAEKVADRARFRMERLDGLAEMLQDLGAVLLKDKGCFDKGWHAKLCEWSASALSSDHTADMPLRGRSLRACWLSLLQSKDTSHLALLGNALLSVVGTEEPANPATAVHDWPFNALLSVHFARANRPADNVTDEDLQLFRARLAKALVIHKLVADEAEAHFCLRVVEVRSALVAHQSEGSRMLKELFAEFLALPPSRTESAVFHLEALLDLDKRCSDPERCGHARTLFWRQRLFCQFVAAFVTCHATTKYCTSADAHRNALLLLLAPLLRLLRHLNVDSLLRELSLLLPVIIDAIAQFGQKREENRREVLFSLLLEALRILLERVPAELLANNRSPPPEGGPQTTAETLVPSLTRILLQSNGKIALACQILVLDCLDAIARRQLVSREVLLLLHASVLQATEALSGSRKRLVRRKVAATRNAWELALF